MCEVKNASFIHHSILTIDVAFSAAHFSGFMSQTEQKWQKVDFVQRIRQLRSPEVVIFTLCFPPRLLIYIIILLLGHYDNIWYY